jgi:LPXTG-motif cell wall-anchored protein
MNNNTMAAILWIGAGLILVLYLMRRSRRKKRR